MAGLSKSAQVLYEILCAADIELGRTQLIKLAYMSDLASWHFRGRPISGFRWVFEQHGPFDSAFYGCLNELGEDLVRRRPVPRLESPTAERVSVSDRNCPAAYSLDDEERLIIKRAAELYAGMPRAEFVEGVVYNTEPMIVAERGAVLNMSAGKLPMSERFSLSTALQSLEELERGEYVTLDELEQELRGS